MDMTEHNHETRATARRILGLPPENLDYLAQIEAMQLKGKALHAEAVARNIVGRSSMKAQVLRTAVFFAREKQRKEAEYSAMCARWITPATFRLHGPTKRDQIIALMNVLFLRTHPQLTCLVKAAVELVEIPYYQAAPPRLSSDNCGILIAPRQFEAPEKKQRYRDPRNKEKQRLRRRKRKKLAGRSARKNRR